MSLFGELISVVELRNWIILWLGALGAYISIKTYINSTRQRKIENTFKILDFLRQHIADKQIETFIELFQANNELGGAKINEFRFNDGRTETIENMFSEGGCGNGDITNMIELFNLISPTFKDLEINIIWYEYGQIMSKVYQWTKYFENEIEQSSANNKYPTFYSDFNSYMKKNEPKMLFKPTKYYTYAE